MLFFLLVAPACREGWAEHPVADAGASAETLLMPTTRTSYYELDEKGQLVSLPPGPDGVVHYSVREAEYRFSRRLIPAQTALIIMDAWPDSGSPQLNQLWRPIYADYILPAVRHAMQLGMQVLCLTNDPIKHPTQYTTRVYPELEKLAAEQKIILAYHDDFAGSGDFADFLKKRGITSLIYTGFASNACVIARPTGIIPMFLAHFKLYFMPEASAALEWQDTWQSKGIHKATTRIISQFAAEIIAFNDFMSAPLLKKQ
ncbi:MAG: hypothetical protein FWH34_07510 [Desulfovibrionaceae bacterium]|nr:hypothetical protein [Desulfovibrionaceae bacterium]